VGRLLAHSPDPRVVGMTSQEQIRKAAEAARRYNDQARRQSSGADRRG
jgi:hypothetical protein